MKIAFYITITVILFFWLLGIASDHKDKELIINKAGEHDCGEYTGGGWNECMIKQIEGSFTSVK